MAQQTKSRNPSKAASGGQSASRKTSNKSRTTKSGSGSSRSSNGRRAASRSATARRSSSSRSRSGGANKRGSVASAKEAASKGANTAGDAVATTARKLKTPALAAGAGLAGLAGGIALSRDRRKRVLGVKLPRGGTATKNLAGTAKNVGALAERTGQVAEQVRVASEALSETGSRRRSPVEVVLQGLTARARKGP